MSEEIKYKEYIVIQKCLVKDHLCEVGEEVRFPENEKVPSDVFKPKSDFYGMPKKPEFEVKSTGGIMGNAKQLFDEPKTIREKADALGIKYSKNISDEGLQKLIDAHNKGK